MVISNGEVIKNLILYPPVEPSSPNKPWFTLIQITLLTKGCELENEEIRSILTIGEAFYFKDEIEVDAIITFIISTNSVSDSTRQLLEFVMSCNVQEAIKWENEVENVPVILPRNNVPI